MGGQAYLATTLAEAARMPFFNLSLDPMCVLDPEGTFRLVNAAFERALDVPASELMHRRCADQVHPDDVAATLIALQRALSGQGTHGFVNRMRHRDGGYRSFQWSCAVPAPGGPIYAVARDITERQRIEEALRPASRSCGRSTTTRRMPSTSRTAWAAT